MPGDSGGVGPITHWEVAIRSFIVHNRVPLSASFAMGLMALQLAVIRLSPSDVPVRIVLPMTVALAPFALWTFRRHAGTVVIFVGLAANLTAILANGGLMPIERHTVAAAAGEDRATKYEAGAWLTGSKDVLLAPGNGRLVALGDGIVVRAGTGGLVVSAGDIVIWVGLMLLAAEASLGWQRRERGEATGGVEESPVLTGGG